MNEIVVNRNTHNLHTQTFTKVTTLLDPEILRGMNTFAFPSYQLTLLVIIYRYVIRDEITNLVKLQSHGKITKILFNTWPSDSRGDSNLGKFPHLYFIPSSTFSENY